MGNNGKVEEAKGFEELLTRAMAERYCPICAIMRDKTLTFLCELQLTITHDRDIKEAIISGGGFCNLHFWFLNRLASPISAARLLGDLFAKIRLQLQRFDDTVTTDASDLVREIHCPVCQACASWQENLTALFASKLSDENFRLEYQHSRGLCLPHLARVSGMISSTALKSFVVESTAHQIGSLIEDLKLYVSKSESRHAPGAERDSTYRAIEKAVGGNWVRF